MKTLIKYLVAAVAAAGLAAGSVYAIPTLWLTDGTTTVTIADGSALDTQSAIVGVVGWSGVIGVWSLNVTTGQAYPALGSPTLPTMDLNSVDSSTAAGTLYIYFSADGFTSPGGAAFAKIGGTTDNGTVEYKVGWSSSNVLFNGLVLTDHVYNTDPYSGTDMASFAAVAPYSLTQLIIITHTSGGTTSFDANLKIPEGGTTALLVGFGLLGLGLVARRRVRSAKS